MGWREVCPNLLVMHNNSGVEQHWNQSLDKKVEELSIEWIILNLLLSWNNRYNIGNVSIIINLVEVCEF